MEKLNIAGIQITMRVELTYIGQKMRPGGDDKNI